MIFFSPWVLAEQHGISYNAAIVDQIINGMGPGRGPIRSQHFMTESGYFVRESPSCVVGVITGHTPEQASVIIADGRVCVVDVQPGDTVSAEQLADLCGQLVAKCGFSEQEAADATQGETWGELVSNFRVWMITP